MAGPGRAVPLGATVAARLTGAYRVGKRGVARLMGDALDRAGSAVGRGLLLHADVLLAEWTRVREGTRALRRAVCRRC